MNRCVKCLETFNAWSDEQLSCWKCLPKAKPRAKAQRSNRFVYSDGGRRAEGFVNEDNDCTVRALANATGRSYAECHRWLQTRGRKSGKGCAFSVIVHRDPLIFGHRLDFVRLKRSRGLKVALERNPELSVGTWILHSTQHVAVLSNGKLLDSFDSSRKIIDKAWRVLPPSR